MNELRILKSAVKKAGREVMKRYCTNIEIETKKDNSLLTKADLASNKILTEELSLTGLPILSEEEKDNKERLNNEKVWIIDPLDGTADFIQQTGEFSVMVGLAENGVSVLGAVYLPATGELFYAEKEKGAFVEKPTIGGEKQKIKVSDIFEASKARMVVSRNHLKPEDEKIAKKLKAREFKKTGSNGVKICLIAKGGAEFFVNSGSGMGEWDSCAPEIILKEAGGKITDVNGDALLYNKKEPKNKSGIVASNGLFHNQIIKTVNK
jgi:3'(2'), 5'-bisphosphate nucleotidase